MSRSPVKKKVLHIIDGFGAGGAETWLLSAVRFLSAHPELGWQFDFLATGGHARLFDEEVKRQGCNIYYMKYSFGSFMAFRKYFTKLLRANNYYAVHDHQDFVSGWHFLAGAGVLPHVRIVHLHNPYNFVRNYVTSINRWFSFRVGRLLTALLATKITGTSNSVMDEYGYDRWPFIKKRTLPAYCGFDINKFIYRSDAKADLVRTLGWNDCKIALFVGRIGLHDYDKARNQKNPSFALDVAVSLVNQHSNWRFIFVGHKGKLGEKMEADIDRLGLSGRIIFMGLRDDVHKLMSASDVLVFPSLWEGLGMVAVEAQATGLVVIMSDSVPAEAVVCKELVKLKSINLGAEEWVKEIVAAGVKQVTRIEFASRIANSPFSIDNSVRRLIGLYTGHDG